MGCISVKPAVDGLEEELSGKLLVLRIDVQSVAGKELAAEFGPIYTPTFVLFDQDGNQINRFVAQLPTEQIQTFIETQ
jgi:thioredoxin-like negative regulator of GroEL